MIEKRVKKIDRLFLITTILVFNLSGCVGYNAASESPVESKTKIKIGVAMYDADDCFIHTVYDQIEHYAQQETEYAQVEIKLEMADGRNNQEIQNGQIEAFINEEYDAIAVNLVDRAQASTIINKAQKANIPLVFFNREPVPQDMYIWEDVYYVGAKAEQSGKLQAEILMSAMKDGLNIDRNEDGIIQYVMLEGEPGHQDAILRTYYSIKTLEEKDYKVENIASDTGMWRKDVAKEKMLMWLDQLGDEIEVVFANNDEMALGVIEALEEKGYYERERWIPVIGVDGMKNAKQAVKEGKMLGTVFNNAQTQAEAILAKLYTMVMDEDPKTITNAEYESKYFHTDYGIIDETCINE